LHAARYVIVNYELLVSQHARMSGGVEYVREDLGGWAPTLAKLGFDVAICDEGHMLRGWTTSQKRIGESRRERVREALWDVPRVWMVTGTPFFGFTRDIWGQLDIASKGLWSDTERGVPGRRFMARYCEGHKAQYGFSAKGRSIYAETELVRRLKHVMIKRPRAEIFEHVPPKPRSVVRLDIDGVRQYVPGMKSRTALADMIRELADAKRDLVMPQLIGELAEGNKIIVFTYHVPSAKKAFKALESAIARGKYKARLAEVNTRAWLATGVPRDRADEPEELDVDIEDKSAWARSSKARHELARTFREHPGAGVIVATIDAMQVAISLKGAQSVHFLDLHWSPGAMAQAEDRPYSHDIKDLSIVYYVARKSVDDHIEAEVLPKVETLARLAREKGAEAMLEAFGGVEKQTFEAVWARLTAHLHRGVDASAPARDDR
jgi:hypothetical protein